MTYADKLKDQRWQKKRLELFELASWQCQARGCENQNEKPQLHVHHKAYLRKTNPWEYEDFCYLVVCDECHEKQQACMEAAHLALAKFPNLQEFCAILGDCRSEEAGVRVSEALYSMTGLTDRELLRVASVIESISTISYSAFTSGMDCAIANTRKEEVA